MKEVNKGGRPKGSKDKLPRAGYSDFSLLRNYLFGAGMQTVIEEVNTLSGIKFVNAYCKCMEFVAPKMTKESLDINVSFDLSALHEKLNATSAEDIKAGVIDVTSEKRLEKAKRKEDSILGRQIFKG